MNRIGPVPAMFPRPLYTGNRFAAKRRMDTENHDPGLRNDLRRIETAKSDVEIILAQLQTWGRPPNNIHQFVIDAAQAIRQECGETGPAYEEVVERLTDIRMETIDDKPTERAGVAKDILAELQKNT